MVKWAMPTGLLWREQAVWRINSAWVNLGTTRNYTSPTLEFAGWWLVVSAWGRVGKLSDDTVLSRYTCSTLRQVWSVG